MELLELAFKIIFCLLLAGLIGWIVGFLLGRIFGSANATQLLNDCEGRMRMRDQDLAGLRSDLTTANAKTASLETELATLATTLKTRDGWVSEMEAKNKDLQADLDARISELDELKAESEQAIADLRSQLEKAVAGSEWDALRVRVAEAEGALKSLRHEQGELNTLRVKFGAQEKELATALIRLKNLEPVVDEVRQREAELVALRKQLVASEVAPALPKAVDAQVNQLSDSMASLVAARALLNDRDGELAHMRLRLSELEPLVTDVQQREAKVRALGSQLQGREAEFATLVRDKDTEIARLKVRLTELELMVREVKEPVVRVSRASSLPSSNQEGDDLKKIFGIGPVLEKVLNSHGIYWFRQIADWTTADVQRYDTLLEDFRGRIERDDWVRGARQEHQKKYGQQL